MVAVFKTVGEDARAYSGGFDSHTPPPGLIAEFGFGNSDFGFALPPNLMTQDEMKLRTKQFALRVIRLVESLPNNKTSNILGGQLLRSGTSVGANYRAACRAKSIPDFINKLAIVEEEADESIYWIELLVSGKQVKGSLVEGLLGQANEILSIVIAAIRTTKNKRIPKSQIRNPKS